MSFVLETFDAREHTWLPVASFATKGEAREAAAVRRLRFWRVVEA